MSQICSTDIVELLQSINSLVQSLLRVSESRVREERGRKERGERQQT